MTKNIKKVCYLREDQVEKMIEYVFSTYKNGTRSFNESSLCRVALDLLFSFEPELNKFRTEEELLNACRARIK